MTLPDKDNNQKPAACGGNCSKCTLDPPDNGGPKGWRLSLAAAGVFLTPMLAALVAAIVAPGGQAAKAGWAGVGLAIGFAVAIGAGRVISHKSGKESA